MESFEKISCRKFQPTKCIHARILEDLQNKADKIRAHLNARAQKYNETINEYEFARAQYFIEKVM